MSVRRPVPPPPLRRNHVNEVKASTTRRTSIADRVANLNLDPAPRKVPPPPPRKLKGVAPPIPYHTRPPPAEVAQALARYPQDADPRPETQPSRRRVPPLPVRLPTPPPESRSELDSALLPADDHIQSNDEGCIECYDFSAVDSHAAQFPRHSVTSLHDLALSLTSPFPSETEKARAIFTWLHHNIAYDTASFFSGNITAQSPDDTLVRGLAVCDGYAGLFCHLAERASLQAYKVIGHGKGYGYQPLAPGELAPPYQGNHAWNCVLMDGEWRLIDPCWGAGHVKGSTYTQEFTPYWFTSSPIQFGKRHYPEDPSYQLLSEDVGDPVSWEDYIGLEPEGPQLFKDFYTFDFSPAFVQPASKYLIRGQPANFQLFKRCQHMSTAEEDNYAYFLQHEDAQIPLERNAGGGWSADIPIIRTDVKLLFLQTFNGRDAKRMTAKQFLSSTGRRTWSWSCLAEWTVL